MVKATSQRQVYLVTGGAGFIGSHLVGELLARGRRVLAIDDLSTGSIGNLAGVIDNPDFEFTQGSITDGGALNRLVEQADVIFHLAAAVGVKLIVEDPVRVIETNIKGTEDLLKVARQLGRRVLMASTSEVYGKNSKVPFCEDDDLLFGPTNKSRWSYGATKMVGEFLGLAYHQEFGSPVSIFRLFNTIGPRQSGQYGMVVPRFVRQALRGEPITVYGDGRQTRCFCDVRDVVEALLGLSEHPDAFGKVHNVGSDQEISIQGVAEKVKSMTGSDSPIVKVPYEEAYAPGFEDVSRRVPDTSRIHSLLSWKPRHSLEQTLETVMRYEAERIKADSGAAELSEEVR